MPTLAELDAQIRALEDQKKQVVQKAKDEAVKKAEAAIAELRAMGFNYTLALGDRPVPIPRGSGTRRTGIRDQVLTIVKASADGISRADLLDHLSVKGNKSAEQSVSNALAALKKSNTIGQKDGRYIAA